MKVFENRKNILVLLLVMNGVFGLKSAVSYVHSASDTEVSGMLDALTNADLNSAMFVAAVTGPKSSIELQGGSNNIEQFEDGIFIKNLDLEKLPVQDQQKFKQQLKELVKLQNELKS